MRNNSVHPCKVDAFTSSERSLGETHRMVKEELVSKEIFPDTDSIPPDLINFVIESWGHVYEAGYKDGLAAWRA